MNETVTRRLSPKNLKSWGKPDLVLIDGGKSQLDAALQARDNNGQSDIPFIGLAKRQEQVVVKGMSINQQKLAKLDGRIEISKDFTLISLPRSTHIIRLLQRIRDESHRFAVTYHTTLKRTGQTTSMLDGIAGIGPKTRSKLIRRFGSARAVKDASESDIANVIGISKAKLVHKHVKGI